MVPAVGRAPELAERLLFQEAVTLAARAYAPYSGFAVGAVVVGPSGRSHHGVNVENASYPAGICAERGALAAMVVFGERRLRFVAVAAASGRDCLPCGLCLQALSEFGDPEIVARVGGEVRVLRLHDLLAAPFAASDLGGDEPAAAGDGGPTAVAGDGGPTAGDGGDAPAVGFGDGASAADRERQAPGDECRDSAADTRDGAP